MKLIWVYSLNLTLSDIQFNGLKMEGVAVVQTLKHLEANKNIFYLLYTITGHYYYYYYSSSVMNSSFTRLYSKLSVFVKTVRKLTVRLLRSYYIGFILRGSLMFCLPYLHKCSGQMIVQVYLILWPVSVIYDIYIIYNKYLIRQLGSWYVLNWARCGAAENQQRPLKNLCETKALLCFTLRVQSPVVGLLRINLPNSN